MERVANKTCRETCPRDYIKRKAAFQQYKDTNTNWKDVLLAYRADKIKEWNQDHDTEDHDKEAADVNTVVVGAGEDIEMDETTAERQWSYDSGTFLSEADAKIMMDKIEARSKWLKANGKRQQFGKHQRAILARAKFKADDDSGIPRQQAHEVSTHTVRNWYRYLARDNNPKAFRAIYLFPLHGESETDLRNIWAAMQQLRNISATSGRAAYKSCPSSHDYSKLKAVFQQFKDANTNWKDILLAYRAEKIRDWNRRWHAIRRAMTVEHSYRGMNTLIKACTSGTLRSRPVTKDIGYAKTMMDKIETRTKWLNANGRARQLEKHQRAIQQHKNAPEDSHTSSLMRR